MNTQEYLITCAMEECNEIAKELSKCNRFGSDEMMEGHHLTNAQRVRAELVDLLSVIDMLTAVNQSFSFNIDINGHDHGGYLEKRIKVQKYLNYSMELGIVYND